MNHKQLKKENKKIRQKLFQAYGRLAIANRTVHDQMKHIEMLNRQLDKQDKAIERKDAQFLGLRMAYQDALINNEV